MFKDRIITSECVGYGHPDKIADQISDAVLDAHLQQDPNTRAGIETMVKDNWVILGGEVRSNAQVDFDEVVGDIFDRLRFSEEHGLGRENIKVVNLLGLQSAQIAQGVDKETGEIGAGDQGFCVGFACGETENLLPLGYHVAKQICRIVCDENDCGLGPDCKAQVTVEYDTEGIAHVKHVLVSTLHLKETALGDVRSRVKELLTQHRFGLSLEQYEKLFVCNSDVKIDINPCGAWTIGGPVADCGITGRKVVVDQFGGYCNVGGGALSGKDMSKVDRSAAYMATYLARNIVNCRLADWAKVTLSYIIGDVQPSAVDVELDENHKANEAGVRHWITSNVDLSPRGIIYRFNSPILYYDTARYGHYGTGRFPWEKLDLQIQ